ncbi:transcriptional regulator/ LuxR family [Synechococcus sp. BIOS-E4-1]|uniref:response regulator transcription factor n=1 Tax=Synechococcus sp. BIOS-E4-1 TaxID=1400864 RepID=UPI00164852DD|nr:helix-turn-helix transcriptional regulator [Synechococcus sp. BIOS-E4-1]QNI53202.1 transcriptional regulator/ LuxR family [Synechococcus sp. BIOS-E4-1]
MTNFQLTPAEIGVLNLLLEGNSNRAIAETLVLSVRTVESHISSSLGKTGCRSRLQLSLWWLQQVKEDKRVCAGRVPSLPA